MASSAVESIGGALHKSASGVGGSATTVLDIDEDVIIHDDEVEGERGVVNAPVTATRHGHVEHRQKRFGKSSRTATSSSSGGGGGGGGALRDSTNAARNSAVDAAGEGTGFVTSKHGKSGYGIGAGMRTDAPASDAPTRPHQLQPERATSAHARVRSSLDSTNGTQSLIRSSIDAGDLARMGLLRNTRRPVPSASRQQASRVHAGATTGAQARNQRSALSDVHSEIDKLLRGMQGELSTWRDNYEGLRRMWASRFSILAEHPALNGGTAAGDGAVTDDDDVERDSGDDQETPPFIPMEMSPPTGVDGFAAFIAILEEYLDESDGARITLEEELGQAISEADALRLDLGDAREAERETQQSVANLQDDLESAFDRNDDLCERLAKSEEDARAMRARCSALENNVATKEKEMSSLEATCAELDGQLRAAREESRAATDAIGALKVEVLQKDGNIEALRAEVKRTSASSHVHEEHAKMHQAEISQKNDELAELQRALGESTSTIGQAHGERNAAREEVQRLQSEVANAQAACADAEEAHASVVAAMKCLRDDYDQLRADEASRRAVDDQHIAELGQHRRLLAEKEAKLDEAREALHEADGRRVDELKRAEESAEEKMAQLAARLADEQSARKASEDALRAKFETQIEALTKARDEDIESMSKDHNDLRDALVSDFRARERELNAQLRQVRADAERATHDVATLREDMHNTGLSLEDAQRRMHEEQIRADTSQSEAIALRGQLHKSNEQLRRHVAAHRRAMSDVQRDFHASIESASAKLKSCIHGNIDGIIDGTFRDLIIGHGSGNGEGVVTSTTAANTTNNGVHGQQHGEYFAPVPGSPPAPILSYLHLHGEHDCERDDVDGVHAVDIDDADDDPDSRGNGVLRYSAGHDEGRSGDDDDDVSSSSQHALPDDEGVDNTINTFTSFSDAEFGSSHV